MDWITHRDRGINFWIIAGSIGADLISIGAYRSGSAPNVDAAINMRYPIHRFLRQPADHVAPIDQSQQQLIELLADSTGENDTATEADD